MIKIEFVRNNIYFENKCLMFHNAFNKQIRDVIYLDEFIFVKAGKRIHLPNDNYNFEDNIFKFNSKGELLYRTGMLNIEYPIDSGVFENWEASDMSIVNNQLYLGYSKGYEAWFDIETGELIRGQFENRK